MTNQELYAKVEHTLLRVDASEIEVHQCLSEAALWQCKGACIPPAHVLSAMQYREDNQLDTKIISVAAFPLGYQSERTKWNEIKELHAIGCDEIDVVGPIYLAKAGDWDKVDFEVGMYKAAAGDTAVKVIMETGLLDDEEIKRYCEILNRHQIAFAKTSTGFGPEGANEKVVSLLRKELDPSIQIKASGGIRTKEQMLALLEAGADVLGMSKVQEALGGKHA